MKARIGFGAVLLVVLGALVIWGGDGPPVDPRERACAGVTLAAAQGDLAGAERLAAACAASPTR